MYIIQSYIVHVFQSDSIYIKLKQQIDHLKMSVYEKVIRKRYENEEKKKEIIPPQEISNGQKINIQIFNITSRHSKNALKEKSTSTGRKQEYDNQLQQNQYFIETKVKRGASVYRHKNYNKMDEKINISQNNIQELLNGSFSGNKIKKSSEKNGPIRIFKQQIITSQATQTVNNKESVQQQIPIQELHYNLVKFHHKNRLVQN